MRRAFVTGGSRGIGFACAKALAQLGMQVDICGRTPDALLEATEILCRLGADSKGLTVDANLPFAFEQRVRELVAERGGYDVLINNVGGGGRTNFGYDRTWQRNVGAAVSATLCVVENMQKKQWGRVVTIASICGYEATGNPWFSSAKAAEIAFTKTMSRNPEYASRGITFNVVCPGPIWIPGTEIERERNHNPLEFDVQVKQSVPRGKLGTPEDVAAVVAFLCSDAAAHVNGAIITVDGGESVKL